MQKSNTINQLAQALYDFHTEMGVVYKTDDNPFFKSKYASLATILSAIKEPLQKAKLVLTQHPTGENELTTTLIHAPSGEYMASVYKMTPAKNDPQGLGSAITYQRRYAIGAILNLNIEEDDDANAASTPTAKKAKTIDDIAPASTPSAKKDFKI